MTEYIQMLIAAHGTELAVVTGIVGLVAAIRRYGRRHEAATRRRGASLID